ncbi:hypothetical protein EZS27_014938, partial [termite gut metagenome]
LYMRQVRPDRAVESYLPCAELKRYEFELDTHSRIPFYTLADESLFQAVEGRVGTGEHVGEGAVGYVWSRKTRKGTLYSTQSLVLLPGTTLCDEYGSEDKSHESADSYRTKKQLKGDRAEGIITDREQSEQRVKNARARVEQGGWNEEYRERKVKREIPVYNRLAPFP